MSLYQYLTENGYTEYEAEETVIRFENGMPIPEDIRKDIEKFYELV